MQFSAGSTVMGRPILLVPLTGMPTARSSRPALIGGRRRQVVAEDLVEAAPPSPPRLGGVGLGLGLSGSVLGVRIH
ncbi:hypothetical protein nbrc107697_10290 [Gordonia crocea]|uniref:Uncharacterized protein n=1 Tax=Gordonia crocea TaxID=589162 RepID=A0A7I9UW39_9ACTN|nr:hypothetical protein nbrc107697_10290 [Gordonia crocea]